MIFFKSKKKLKSYETVSLLSIYIFGNNLNQLELRLKDIILIVETEMRCICLSGFL